jgi:small-conductance mechanosensitive channel
VAVARRSSRRLGCVGLLDGTWMVERRLRSTSNRLKSTEAEIRELSEQSRTLHDDYAEAAGDALIGGRIEGREATDAQRHLDKATSRLSALREQAAMLRQRQDDLLDKMSKPR